MLHQKGVVVFLIFYLSFIVINFTSNLFAKAGDNRFIPLLSTPYIVPEHKNAYIASAVHFASATSAYNTADRQCALPEFYGTLDLGVLSRAWAKVSGSNPLRSYFQDKSIPCFVDGKVKMQGISCATSYPLVPEISVGGSVLCTRVHTEFSFMLDNLKFAATDSIYDELDQQRRLLFDRMGIKQESSTRVGLQEAEIHIAFGSMWERMFKMRSFSLNGIIGLTFPPTLHTETAAPATIMQGSEKLWGMYLATDNRFVLKEDLWIQVYLQVSKRFSKVVDRRLPVLNEPTPFGAAVGQVHFDPGITVLFCPSFVVGRLRGGLGVTVSYTLTYHQQDHFTDRRVEKHVPVTLEQMQKTSGWGSDYVSVQVFYDASGDQFDDPAIPIVKFKWDIPTDFFVAKRVAKTHHVMVGVDCSF